MNQFVLCHTTTSELRLFPHILQLGVIKNPAIRLNGFQCTSDKGLKIYYIQEGKFEWHINQRQYTMFPGDVALVLPGVEFGNENSVLEVGCFSWIHIQINKNTGDELITGAWSSLSESENHAVSKILQSDHSPVLQNFTDAGVILKSIQSELFNQEIGYQTKVNHLLDEILIQVTRQFTRISNPGRDFPTTFIKLEQELRRNLAHQWTVEEMAAMVGLGTTLFNEKVKSYSGFSPLSYLINIRIAEAIKLLKKPDISLTDIALDTGFYSSQHFSTTFKKLTGYTPSDFRKNHLRTN
ncbi:MAG: AraC family transcriptional regulator [Lacibacter sp.]